MRHKSKAQKAPVQKCCADYSMAPEELLDFNCGNLSMSEHSIKAEFCPTSPPGSSRFKIKRIYGRPPTPQVLTVFAIVILTGSPALPASLNSHWDGDMET